MEKEKMNELINKLEKMNYLFLRYSESEKDFNQFQENFTTNIGLKLTDNYIIGADTFKIISKEYYNECLYKIDITNVYDYNAIDNDLWYYLTVRDLKRFYNSYEGSYDEESIYLALKEYYKIDKKNKTL